MKSLNRIKSTIIQNSIYYLNKAYVRHELKSGRSKDQIGRTLFAKAEIAKMYLEDQ